MRTGTFRFTLICAMVGALVSDVLAQPEPEFVEDRRKLGQTGMQFLTVPVNPRAAALGGALTALGCASTSLFYNPATMAIMDNFFHISLAQNKWIADINYNQGSLAFSPAGGLYGVFGLTFLSVDYGELEETIRYDNDAGFLNIGTFSPSASAVGVGYARALTEMFSVGAHVKYVTQNLGESIIETPTVFTDTLYTEPDPDSLNYEGNTESAYAVDFGVVYRTGFRSLVFAMSVRNFSRQLTFVQEKFEMPLVFQLGIAMDLVDLTGFDKNMHSLVVSLDRSHPRSYVEQMKIGVEYTLLQTLALRAGYRTPTDEPELNLGFGLQTSFGGMGFGFDYAYTQFGAFGTVNRMSAQFSF